MPGTITYQQYDEMYKAYAEKQTIGHVSKITKISPATVSKYINEGDQERNLPPIKARFEHAMQNRRRKQDLDLSRAKDVLAVAAYNMITKIAHHSRDIELQGIDPAKLPKMLLDLQGVLRYVIGDSDVNISADNRFKKFENMTNEELLEYWKKGIDKDKILSESEE